MATYRPQSPGLVRARVRAENAYGVTFSREITLQVAAAPAITGGYHDRRRVYRGTLSGPTAQVVQGGHNDARRAVFPGVLTAEGTLPLVGGFVDRRAVFDGSLGLSAPGQINGGFADRRITYPGSLSLLNPVTAPAPGTDWTAQEDPTRPGGVLVDLDAGWTDPEGQERRLYIGTTDPDTLTDSQLITLSGAGPDAGEQYASGSTWPDATVYVLFFLRPTGSSDTITDRSAVASFVTEPATAISADSAPTLGALADGDTVSSAFTSGSYSTNNSQTIISEDVTFIVLPGGGEVPSSYEGSGGEDIQALIVVTASDGATQDFSTPVITVSASESPVITAFSVSGSTFTLGLDRAADVYWVRHATGNAPVDAADVIDGTGGYDSGSFSASASGDYEQTFAGGNDGAQEISIVARVDEGTPSEISTIAITVDTVGAVDAWAFTGSTVTNLPASEGWAFTGSVIDTIPEAA